MAQESEIEATDATSNPATGGAKVAPGGDNRHPELFAEPIAGHEVSSPRTGFRSRTLAFASRSAFAPEKPRMIFVKLIRDQLQRTGMHFDAVTLMLSL